MPAPAPPEVVDAALMAKARGVTNAEAARIAGVSPTAVGDWLHKWRDRAERCAALARSVWARNVLSSADAASRALTSIVLDPEERGSDRAQASRALWEPLRGPEAVTINGDVSVAVQVDNRRVELARGADATAAAERLDAIERRLGIR